MTGIYARKTRESFTGRSKTDQEFWEKVEIINKLKLMSGFAREAIGGMTALSVVSNIMIGIVGDVMRIANIPISETAPKLIILTGKQHICAEIDAMILDAIYPGLRFLP